MHRVREPHIVAQPIHGFHPLDRALPVPFECVLLLIERLRQVSVQSNGVVLAGKFGRVLEKVGGNRER